LKSSLDTWKQNLILGTAQLSRSYGQESSPLTTEEPVGPLDLLSEAFNLGIKKIDTSPNYGEAEDHIGKFSKRHEIQVQTKFRFEDTRKPVEQVAKSTERMDLEGIWSAVMHDPFNLLNANVEFSRELWELRASNPGTRLGSSIYSPDEIPRYSEFESSGSVVQLPAGLLIREVIEANRIRALKKSGLKVQIRSLYMQGMLVSAKPIKRAAEFLVIEKTRSFLSNLASEFGCTPHALLVSHAFETLGADEVVVGVSHPSELEDLVKSLESVFRNLATVCSLIESFARDQKPSSDETNPLKW
jgi:aryl-alcohol dehydrogenase-like predicted oxidoreductase